MAKPPVDADPEQFIIGTGHYNNLRLARPYHDEHVFRIDPAPMPVWSIVILNLVFVAFFSGFLWTVQHFRQDETGLGLIYGAVIGIGLLTCVLFTVIGYRSFARANRLGPWLIYHKQSGEVELPREEEKFDRSEIVHLQYITTKLLWWGGVLNNERYSEINLVTSRDGIRKRWPLLKSGFNVKAFEWLLKPLQEQTNLPVVRVQDEWWGWKVTETPYGKTGSPR